MVNTDLKPVLFLLYQTRNDKDLYIPSHWFQEDLFISDFRDFWKVDLIRHGDLECEGVSDRKEVFENNTQILIWMTGNKYWLEI